MLPDRLREETLECVSAIAEDLSSGAAPSDGIEAHWHGSLAYGTAGLALFFHYLHLSDVYPEAVRWRDAFLSSSTQAITQQRMPADLYRGFSGIAWVWKHVHRELASRTKEAAWAEIDQALQTWVKRESTPAELLEGLGGICLYLAECQTRSGEDMLSSIVSKLEAEAEPQRIGTAFAMSKKMRQHWAENFGQEPVNLWKISVAHGNAGCLGGLVAAMTSGSCLAACAHLLTAGCDWIWSQQSSEMRAFPEIVGADMPCLTSGWCNGDLGIALTLFHVARRLGRPDWQERSLAIARAEALVRVDEVEPNNRRNYCLCHGHAGRGHIFNGLYQVTGEDIFAEAAIYWFEQCLALRAQGEGIGGFSLEEGFDRGAKAARGFLMGASGLGLALLAAATPVPPDWDRLLLVSMREA